MGHGPSAPRRIGVSIEIKPHAYDPAANPELFEGVLARRLIAFVIDLVDHRHSGAIRGVLHLRVRPRDVGARLGAVPAVDARRP